MERSNAIPMKTAIPDLHPKLKVACCSLPNSRLIVPWSSCTMKSKEVQTLLRSWCVRVKHRHW
ncbi:hypothetical protein CsSME_00008143 [Camellia sinensis var. sinensis]